MAFKQVADLNPDTTISLGGVNKKTGKNNPTSVEGYYLGSRKVDDRKKKSGFSYIHVFQTSKGTLGVWGKTDMDRKVIEVTPGMMTKVTFSRMVSTPNGDMYKFTVEFDDSNTTEVSLPSGNQGIEASGGHDSGSDEDQDYLDEEDGSEGYGSSAVDEDFQQQQALAAAERRAKTEAILSRGKSAKGAKN